MAEAALAKALEAARALKLRALQGTGLNRMLKFSHVSASIYDNLSFQPSSAKARSMRWIPCRSPRRCRRLVSMQQKPKLPQ